MFLEVVFGAIVQQVDTVHLEKRTKGLPEVAKAAAEAAAVFVEKMGEALNFNEKKNKWMEETADRLFQDLQSQRGPGYSVALVAQGLGFSMGQL